MFLLLTLEIKVIVVLNVLFLPVSRHHFEGEKQTRFFPRFPGHPHTQGQHCCQRSGMGTTQLPGGEVSHCFCGVVYGLKMLHGRSI